MLLKDSKRAASTSPERDPKDSAKRPRLQVAEDLWSNEEHHQLDEEIKRRLIGKDGKIGKCDVNDTIYMAIVLSHVVEVVLDKHSHLYLPPSAARYINALESDPDLLRIIGEAYTSGSYNYVRCLEFLRANTILPFQDHTNPTYGQKEAVERSWEREFLGNAAQALWAHIMKYYNRRGGNYANCAAIVQSSGMGKSRTVDELGKDHFVIPINLRYSHSTGFPPADGGVAQFFTADKHQGNAYSRACAFLAGR